MKLASNTPAPTSRAKASATCAAANVCRSRRCLLESHGRARVAAQGVSGRGLRESNRRQQPERDRRRHGRRRGHEQDRQVERDGVEARQRVLTETLKHTNTAEADGQAKRSAQRREDEAFDEELRHQTAPAGAKCGADGELRRAAGRSHQGEIGHVDADDEQHEQRSDRQQAKRLPGPSDDVVLKREGGKLAQSGGRPGLAHRPAERPELRASLAQTHALPQAPDRGQRIVLLEGVSHQAVQATRHQRHPRWDPEMRPARCR